MILYMLDIKKIKKRIYKYLILSVFFLAFGLIYEMFSHGVYSNYMLYAFAIPLIFGFIVYLIIYKFNLNRYLSELGMSIYNTFILMLTLGSIMKGFLDIYGTTNKLIFIYFILSIVLIIISVVANVIYNFKKKDGDIMKEIEKGEVKLNVVNEKKVGENMKEKIILFVLGCLVGGLIATGSFFSYTKANSCNNNNNQNVQIQDTAKHEMPSGRPNSQDETNKHQRKSRSNTTDENRTSDKENSNTNS